MFHPVRHASSSSLFMSEDNTNIVPVDKENIQNAVAVTGGFIGFVLAGPLGGVFLAAITNYAVKKDTDTGEALRLVLTLYFKLQNLFLKL